MKLCSGESLFLKSRFETSCRANEEGLHKLFPQMLHRYEAMIIRLRQCLGTIHFHGRDHLIRETRRCYDFYKTSKFQFMCEAWIVFPFLLTPLITPKCEGHSWCGRDSV